MSKQNFDSPFESPTLVQLLTNRASLQRDERAFTFLPDVASEDLCITFGELEKRARAIGAWLQHEGAAGERVLLLYPSGLDYIAAFFGCMCAGAIAVPVYPPRLNRPMPDLEAICVDAQPALALTTASVLSNIERRLTHSTGLKTLRWIAIEEVPTGLEDDWREPPVNVDGVAFLQYTSGSTGARRGTKVSHRNIMHNLALIRYGFELGPDGIGAFWLPMHHDMGLIGAILEPFFIGRPSILMSPASFLQRPVKWLEAITRFKATITGAPNFAFDFCINRIAPEDRSALDLSSLKVVFCGAEPIRNETLERFAQAFEQSGFRREMYYPCYGLAEATLLVSGAVGAGAPVVQHVRQSALTQNKVLPSSAGESDSRTFIGCGKTFPGQKIIIVHPERLVQLPSDEIGEIWVSGPSVTQGYWNCPEETERIFHAYLADSGEGPFLRTGDLGFLRDGELFVTGRFKDLIIINGRNYYPHDIERTVGYSHPSLRLDACAAFSVEAQGSERLVIVQEVSRGHLKTLSVPDVVEAIRQAVTEEYDLSLDALVLIKPGTIPKTSSGKIQRGSCRSAFMNDGLQKIGEWSSVVNVESTQVTLAADQRDNNSNLAQEHPFRTAAEIETWLIRRIANRLGLPESAVEREKPFSHYGINSVEAVSIAGDLATWLDATVSPTLAWDYPCIKLLAAHLAIEDKSVTDVHSTYTSPPIDDNAVAIIGMGCRFPGAS
ncbi:MAG TPA: AMP-binding protein, partial [Pyrinomonadaceae bacterium]|nr:AMP-binding protein [Pyrinomonadaceae bacterium]